MQKIVLGLGLTLLAGVAHSADAPTAPGVAAIPRADAQAPNNAVGFKIAPGLRGSAAVGLETVYNSNFFLQPDNPQSSFGFVLTPGLQFVRDAGSLRYQIGLGAEAAKYTGISSGPNEYLDGTFTAGSEWRPLTRHKFSFDGYSKYGHDPFGSFRTENNLNLDQGLDKWLESSGRVRYRFGAPGALINLETEGGLVGRRYKSNRDQTGILDFRTWDLRETAYINLSSKTALLAEVSHLDFGYYAEAPGFPGRDFQETHYRAGIHWLATGTTTGDVRVGRFRRSYDNPQVPKNDATDWIASLSWAPRVYSVFTVKTGVQAQASYVADVQLIENRFATVDWTHDWNYRFRTRLAYSHLNSEFIGTSRIDDINTVGAEVNYLSSQRWMWLGGASHSRRSSNQSGRDYNDTLAYLGVRYTR